MHWVVKCECGVLLAGADGDELLAAAVRHMRECHPAVSAPPSRSDLLAKAQPADAETGRPS